MHKSLLYVTPQFPWDSETSRSPLLCEEKCIYVWISEGKKGNDTPIVNTDSIQRKSTLGYYHVTASFGDFPSCCIFTSAEQWEN